MFNWLFGRSDGDSKKPQKRWGFGRPAPNTPTWYINEKSKNDAGETLDNKTCKRIRKALTELPLEFAYCPEDRTFIYHDGSRNWQLDPDGTKFVDTFISVGLTEDEAVDGVVYFMKHRVSSHCDAERKAKRLRTVNS